LQDLACYLIVKGLGRLLTVALNGEVENAK